MYSFVVDGTTGNAKDIKTLSRRSQFQVGNTLCIVHVLFDQNHAWLSSYLQNVPLLILPDYNRTFVN